jgi:small-conductance mechanosensitive channel
LKPRSSEGRRGFGRSRLLTSVGGYLVVLVTLLSLLAVPVQKFLLISRPFTVGQWIVVNSGGMGGTYEGRVRSIGLTFTTLETPDGPLSFPNSG